MGAFQNGFRMGQTAWQQALDNQDRSARREQESEAHRLTMEEGGLRLGQLRDDAARRRELAGMRTEIGDYQTGFNRAGFNQTANQDFDALVAASEAGVKEANAARKGVLMGPEAAFAAPQQSNTDYETALRAQKTQAPDVTSDPYQRQMSGLRQRYALTSGDMAGFDSLATAERKRLTDAQDAQYATAVMSDPGGASAKEARTYINDMSRSLSIDTDPKTGISTFRIIKGDKTKPIDIGPADMGKIAVGVRRLQRGDVGGLDVISAVNKDLAAAVREEFKIDLDVGGASNQANFKLRSLENQGKELDMKGQGLRIQRQQADLARMGAAQYREGEDGNTYAVIPTMTRQGLKFETVRVNPDNIRLKKEAGPPGKDVELKTDSIYQTPEGVRYRVASNGEKLIDGAPEPKDRTNMLVKYGFPKPVAEQMQWAVGGRDVKWGGEGYDTSNAEDMRALLKMVNNEAVAGQAMRELEVQGGGARRGMRAKPPLAPVFPTNYRVQQPLNNSVDYGLSAPQ